MFSSDIKSKSKAMFKTKTMVSFTFILGAFVSFCMASNDKSISNKVNVIQDFITLQNKPTKLVVWKNCFENNDMLELMRNSTIFIKFCQKDSLKANEYESDPHHWLFALDLTCIEEPGSVIEKVF
jgi:hypothetical protein